MLCWYKKLWKQLKIVDVAFYEIYHPGPLKGAVTVLIFLTLFHQDALTLGHDIPTVGHLGIEKTLECITMPSGLV